VNTTPWATKIAWAKQVRDSIGFSVAGMEDEVLDANFDARGLPTMRMKDDVKYVLKAEAHDDVRVVMKNVYDVYTGAGDHPVLLNWLVQYGCAAVAGSASPSPFNSENHFKLILLNVEVEDWRLRDWFMYCESAPGRIRDLSLRRMGANETAIEVMEKAFRLHVWNVCDHVLYPSQIRML
jgi:hypothetical protein